jgi:hypothetical protein
MAKKQKTTRSFARTAPKSQEKHLIENAKKLQQDPYLLIPTCSPENERYFRKLRKQLTKIHRFRTDDTKLEKLSHKKGLDGALAGTYLLAISEKAPYLAALSFPTGDIVYAQRGKADKEKLIAVQHFDDPVFRLRGIKDLVFKKNLHVYSWEGGYQCTGQEPHPPVEFVEFIKKTLGLPEENNILHCPHIPSTTVKKKESLTINYLRINWKSAGTIIALCENCAKTAGNTMFTVSKYMLQQNLSDEFDIEVITQVGDHHLLSEQKKAAVVQEYLTGQLTDYDFIKKFAQTQEDHVKQVQENILMLDGVSYGSDVDTFIEALHPTESQKTALEFFLQKNQEPLILSKTTPGKLLERFWAQYGSDFLHSILDENEIADSLSKLDESPDNIISLAFEYKQRQKILSQLPVYETLPPLASFADTVARTYMTFGEVKALAEIKNPPDTPKAKSLSYAFLLVLGKAADVKWKYQKEEIEYGEFLQETAHQLLISTPKDYSTRLQALLTACGSSEKIT